MIAFLFVHCNTSMTTKVQYISHISHPWPEGYDQERQAMGTSSWTLWNQWSSWQRGMAHSHWKTLSAHKSNRDYQFSRGFLPGWGPLSQRPTNNHVVICDCMCTSGSVRTLNRPSRTRLDAWWTQTQTVMQLCILSAFLKSKKSGINIFW